MPATAIKRFQTPLDFATQFGGNADMVIDLCLQNKIGITDDVTPGTILSYTEEDAKTAAYFRKKSFDIITDDNIEGNSDLEGIGYWNVETPEPATIVL
jgi:hypothetical protein